MKILFLHGWRSVVGGVKPTYLKNAGHEVFNPALDDDDFALALAVAQAAYNQHVPDVIVGSSRGGAIAMNISSRDTPLVLLCPAWKNWGTVTQLKAKAAILHSRLDEVIPFEDSEELIQASQLPPETLIEVGSDHRLADEGSLAVMLWACQLLSSGQLIPKFDDPDLAVADSRSQHSSPGTHATGATTTESNAPSQIEGSYICDACGEEIVIPLDISEGTEQAYVEDCPVCCRANTIHVNFDQAGAAQVWAEPL